MELENIIKLMNSFDHTSLASFKLEQDGVTISMEANRGDKEVIFANGTTSVKKEAKLVSQMVPEEYEENQSSFKSGNVVKAPLVGTFYQSASPEQPPFVQVGDLVKKGQVLAIVEAMKLMNEIESEYDGVVKEILIQNEDMVEYGQPLFVIE